jgi:hypothetical protein
MRTDQILRSTNEEECGEYDSRYRSTAADIGVRRIGDKLSLYSTIYLLQHLILFWAHKTARPKSYLL